VTNEAKDALTILLGRLAEFVNARGTIQEDRLCRAWEGYLAAGGELYFPTEDGDLSDETSP